MPLPTPRKGESQKDFIGRCMHESDLPMQKGQRLAACYDSWRKKQREQHVPEMPPPVELTAASDVPPPVSRA